jgi:hypothetical protein
MPMTREELEQIEEVLKKAFNRIASAGDQPEQKAQLALALMAVEERLDRVPKARTL